MNSKFPWLYALYRWCLNRAGHPRAPQWLGGVAFIESIIFPIPPDMMLIPMCLAQPRRAFWFATITTLASVAGGAVGYALGWGAWHWVAQPILELYQHADLLVEVQKAFDLHGWWIVFGGGFTPVPYKLVTLASGALEFSFAGFMLFSLLGRAARFFLVATLLFYGGASARALIERAFDAITIAVLILILGVLGLWWF